MGEYTLTKWKAPTLGEIEKLMGPAEADFATDPPTIFIQTLEGKMRADRGDWIIKGVNGEFYPCKPDIFEKTYEPVQ